MIAKTVAVVVLLTAAVTAAHAQPAAPPKSPEVKAAELLAEASRLYAEEADVAAALEAFRASYDLIPSWRALNGIGLSQRLLGDHVDAYRTYVKLLAEYGAKLTDSQRRSATLVRDDLDSKIGRLTIELVDSEPGQVTVSLNGARLSADDIAGPHLVMPGKQAVIATRDGFQPFATEVPVAAGESEVVKVKLEAEKEKIVIQVEQAPLERRMPVWVPWATVAGGAVIASAGALFALSAKGDFEDFDAAVAAAAGDIPRSTAVDDSAKNSGETKASVATGLFIAGGLVSAAGVVLLVLNSPRRAKVNPGDPEEPNRTSLVISPRSVGVSFRF